MILLIEGYWVVCGIVYFCCDYILYEIDGVIYDFMDL